MGGTIGFAGVGDDFWVALRVLGEDVSLFLSDLTAAVPYPPARQVLEALDIPVPADDELDQVLPAGDLSIFADLGVDEMELDAVAASLDLYPEVAVALIADPLRFGDAVEPSVRDRIHRCFTRPRNCREIDRDPTAHAEIVAIRQAATPSAAGGWPG